MALEYPNVYFETRDNREWTNCKVQRRARKKYEAPAELAICRDIIREALPIPIGRLASFTVSRTRDCTCD